MSIEFLSGKFGNILNNNVKVVFEMKKQFNILFIIIQLKNVLTNFRSSYNLYKFICSCNKFYNGKLLEVLKFYTINIFWK